LQTLTDADYCFSNITTYGFCPSTNASASAPCIERFMIEFAPTYDLATAGIDGTMGSLTLIALVAFGNGYSYSSSYGSCALQTDPAFLSVRRGEAIFVVMMMMMMIIWRAWNGVTGSRGHAQGGFLQRLRGGLRGIQ
jgi:hypothetical protein